MENSQGPAPPPYPGEGPSKDRQWRVQNAKYRSNITTKGEPSQYDFREHLECLRDSLNAHTLGVGCPDGGSHIIEVQHSQAFTNVEYFINAYQELLRKIKPLDEEDILLLLLRRYATSSGASVYAEIRQDNDVHVFDSTVSKPLHTESVIENLINGAGLTHSEMSLGAPREPSISSNTTSQGLSPHPRYESMQASHGVEFPGSVTLNFPAISADDRLHRDSMILRSALPVYNSSQPYISTSPIEWAQIPEKLHPPAFRVHRCHHRGMEKAVDSIFELPFGFPELIHHLYNIPPNVYHTGFYIDSHDMQLLTRGQAAFTAFECHIIPSDARVYITVQQEGSSLCFNCYRDKEIWEASHPYHEECDGCPDS